MDPQTASEPNGPPPNSFLRFAFLLAVVLWCAIPLSPNTVDSDFWGHVRYGQDMLDHGVAHEATYAFTAEGHRWINHEHLSEIIFALGAQAGTPSLLVMKFLFGCLVLALIIKHNRRQGVSVFTIAAVCVIVAVNLSFYWGLRPHVFTFTFFAILIAWTEWCFAGWSGHWNLPWPRSPQSPAAQLNPRRLYGLWICPVLLMVWTNTHGGFLAGVAVYVAILGCRAFEFALCGREHRLRTVAHLSVLAVAGVIATWANPYGAELHQWLFESLRVPRPEINEWHPPDLFTTQSLKLWVLLALPAIGLLGSRRPRDFTHLVVLGIVLFQALQHQRHLPFVALLIGFWIPAHLQSAIVRLAPEQSAIPKPAGMSRPVRSLLAVALLAFCGIQMVQISGRLSGVPVERNRFPVSAFQYIRDQGITGRVIVSGEWAQYTLSVLGARTPNDEGLRVGFDGRFRTCYPQIAVDRHFDFFRGNGGPRERYRSPSSPPADPKAVLVSHNPDLVLLNRRQLHAVDVMQQVRSDWSLLYQDDLAQLWGRASVFDQPESDRYVAPEDRMITSAQQAGWVPWPGAPETRHQTKFVRAN